MATTTLKANITGDASALRSELDGVTGRLDKLGGRFETAGRGLTKFVSGPIAAGAAGLAGLVTATANEAAELANLADQAGMTAEQMQVTSKAMNRLGVEQETSRDGLRELNLRLGEAATEGGAAAEGFQALDISLRDANGQIRSSGDVLPEVLDRLSQMDSDARRSATAAKVFGDEAGFAFAQVASRSGDLEAATEAVRESGSVMSNEAVASAREFDRELDALTQQGKALAMELGTDLMPIMADTVVPFLRDDVAPAVRTVADGLSTMVEGFEQLPEPIQGAAGASAGFLAALGPLAYGGGKAISGVARLTGRIKNAGGVTAVTTSRLRSMGTFLAGPWGLVLAGATKVVTDFIGRQRKAQETTAFLRRELQGEEADLSSLTDQLLVTKLRNDDVLTTLQDQGLSLEHVRQVVNGSESAWQRFTNQLGYHNEEQATLVQGLTSVNEHWGRMQNELLPGVESQKMKLFRAVTRLRDRTNSYNASLDAESRLTDDVTTSTDRMGEEVRSSKEAADALARSLHPLPPASRSVEAACEVTS